MSNTLFNYFTKSPADNGNKTSCKEPVTPKGNVSGPKFTPKSSSKKKKSSDGSGPTAKKAKTGESTPKSSHKKDSKENKTPNGVNSSNDSVEQDDEDEFENSPEGSGKKRKRLLLLESDGSEDEYKPESGHESSESEVSADESSELETNEETEDEPTPQKLSSADGMQTVADHLLHTRAEDGLDSSETYIPNRIRNVQEKNKKRASSKKSGSVKKVVKKLEGNFLTPNKPKLVSSTESSLTGAEGNVTGQDGTYSWPHLKLDFLKPDKIRDIKNRRPNDPGYDQRTLRIPEDFKKNLTPAHKQWWDMKATHFDCVLFFKVGKFYELFHMDAVIGVNELNLTYMKGEFAHSGFPEIAYGRFSTTLVEKGYKVARIEQTETPDMMEKRCKTLPKVTKFDKVVKREICQITTRGTRVYSIIDGDTSQAEAQFLLAICEKKFDTGGSAYGVCFVDTSIGIFHLGQFIDDKQCSRLRTLIAHYPPAQILFERGHISKKTQQLLNVTLSAVLKDALLPDNEFWSSSKTLLQLLENNYFDKDSMPEQLKKFVGESDSLGLTASEEGELAVRSLGAVTWYLKRCQLDHQLLSMEKFSIYVPVDSEDYVGDSVSADCSAKRMVLDAVTLKNLHVLENSCGGIEGTLLHKLDNCNTAFGKRLLYQWICSPLFNIKGIIDRQKAISVLIENSHVMEELRPLLNQLPDLERMLSRIFAQSTYGLDPSHPENRAIMFEEKTYSKKRIVEFTNVLSGFQNAQNISEVLQESGICDDCDLLRQCSHFPTNAHPGKFPDLSSHLDFFKNAFDHDEALKEGRIIPSAGVDNEYDCAIEALQQIDVESKEYLKEQCKVFCAKVTYVGTDKKRFQLEVPESACKRAGNEYEIQGQRKGYKRFWTPKCRELLEKQIAAEDLKTSVLQDLRRRIFSRFSERVDDWRAAVQCLSVIDVLMSLADYSRGQDCDISVPKFEYFVENVGDDNSLAVVNVRSGRFPCSTGDEVFIPNDTVIGEQGSSLVLVTGPNMGGKSTLMRQLGLIVILAQMGCHVPATSVFLNPVDRIFTRLGANDDIMSGESTFYMELSETSAILKHSTKHSLVLIDELGRGTSTYDGTAIAASVLNELTSMKCRTLFSTHYHSLVEDFKHFKTVKLGHMSCMAETEEDIEGSNKETVTFLYKFAEGACPKSYGFNAARLAGVPNDIIKLGQQHSKQLEHESMQRKLFKILFSQQQKIKLREIVAEIS